MFVRWKRRRANRHGYERWSAALVESVRTEKGPRTRYIIGLGSVRTTDTSDVEGRESWRLLATGYGEGSWDVPIDDAIKFWDTAEKRLDELDIDPEDRREVVAALRERVPRPTEAQRKRREKEKYW